MALRRPQIAAALSFVITACVLSSCGGNSAPKAANQPGATDAVPTATATTGAPTVKSGPPPTATARTSGSPTPSIGPSVVRLVPADRSQAGTTAATVLLATLATKGRAAKTNYARTQFGAAWTDDNASLLGHNGCDTRNDILRRDLTTIVFKPGSNSCAVNSGLLLDPYTAEEIPFQRGSATSTRVQIDHVVALSDAWQKGAQGWTAARRTAFANDPLNLLAVDGPANQSKGDGDAATWLPPNKAYRCAYVARQVAIKTRYGLSVTAAERGAVSAILVRCNGIKAPTEPGRPPADPSPTPQGPAPSPVPSPRAPTADRTQAAPTPAGPSESVYYANCTAVRNAGKAPLYRGDPGYASKLDRDGDGVACE